MGELPQECRELLLGRVGVWLVIRAGLEGKLKVLLSWDPEVARGRSEALKIAWQKFDWPIMLKNRPIFRLSHTSVTPRIHVAVKPSIIEGTN